MNSVNERFYNDQSDTLTGLKSSIENATLLDFWKWAFRDLCDDDVKGVFAEWIVAKLINHKTHRRISWADSDLILEDGTRIEVKASSFWQSWKLLDGNGRTVQSNYIPDRGKIRFSGLKARNISLGQWNGEAGLKSDLYVFAFQHEESSALWNAMDLSQWEFYVAAKEDFTTTSVSLASLESRGFGPLGPEQVAAAVIEKIETRNARLLEVHNHDSEQ